MKRKINSTVQMREKPKSNEIPWWVKSIVILGVTFVLCFKIIETDFVFNIDFDFPTFLSLLLALFSVGLAALFYFKATDSSNAFYNNTYRFTQDISTLLAKIESGFGEKLRNLDDSYKGMQNRFDNISTSPEEIIQKESAVKESEEIIESKMEEREKYIEELLNRTQFQEDEKSEILSQLKDKDKELRQASIKLEQLREELVLFEMMTEDEKQKYPSHYLNSYMEIMKSVSHYLTPEFIRNKSIQEIRSKFIDAIKKGIIPENLIRAMKDPGFMDDNYLLNPRFIKNMKNIT